MIGTLRFVGLAMITAVAPVVVVAGTAHRMPIRPIRWNCSVQGARTRAADGRCWSSLPPTMAPLWLDGDYATDEGSRSCGPM